MLTVDRIEEAKVICQDEDGNVRLLALADFDGAVREGDCVVSDDAGRFRVDEEQTRERRKRMAARYRSLLERKKK